MPGIMKKTSTSAPTLTLRFDSKGHVEQVKLKDRSFTVKGREKVKIK